MPSWPAYCSWRGISEEGKPGHHRPRSQVHLPEGGTIDPGNQLAIPQIGAHLRPGDAAGWKRPCRGRTRRATARKPDQAGPWCRDSGGKRCTGSDAHHAAAPLRRRHAQTPAARSANRNRTRRGWGQSPRRPAAAWLARPRNGRARRSGPERGKGCRFPRRTCAGSGGQVGRAVSSKSLAGAAKTRGMRGFFRGGALVSRCCRAPFCSRNRA